MTVVMIDVWTEAQRIREPEFSGLLMEEQGKAAQDEVRADANIIYEFSSPDSDKDPASSNTSEACWHVWPPDVQAESACTLCGLDYQEWTL